MRKETPFINPFPESATEPKAPVSALAKLVSSRNFKVSVKVDSKGRKGKTVTIIAGLPKHELFLKEMTRQLKEKCGAGGSYLLDGKDGEVVIQGNHLERIRAFLDAENILVK